MEKNCNKKGIPAYTGIPSIGVARLELAASTSLTWRASQLRYTPAICSCALKTCDANFLKRKSYYTESIQQKQAFFILF